MRVSFFAFSTLLLGASSLTSAACVHKRGAQLQKRTSGQATYYNQGGAAGSCGQVNSDDSYVVAVSAADMNSGLCGKTVHITNTENGKSVSATVADTCPGCGSGSLDLSIAAFNAIGDPAQGVLPITWTM